MYLDARAAVDEHLADQLVLSLALAGQGRFSAKKIDPAFPHKRSCGAAIFACHSSNKNVVERYA